MYVLLASERVFECTRNLRGQALGIHLGYMDRAETVANEMPPQTLTAVWRARGFCVLGMGSYTLRHSPASVERHMGQFVAKWGETTPKG